MTNEHDASLSPSFVGAVERMERFLRHSGNSTMGVDMRDLLSCIREQQAAIEALLDYHEDDNPHGVAHSRAVLEKWRIE